MNRPGNVVNAELLKISSASCSSRRFRRVKSFMVLKIMKISDIENQKNLNAIRAGNFRMDILYPDRLINLEIIDRKRTNPI